MQRGRDIVRRLMELELTPEYRLSGKTGTARKPQDTGTYRDRAGNYHYVAAFTGMVPAEDPELSIIVVIDEPTATIYGGSAAAPVFADLASFALSRFRIPPAASRPPNCHWRSRT